MQDGVPGVANPSCELEQETSELQTILEKCNARLSDLVLEFEQEFVSSADELVGKRLNILDALKQEHGIPAAAGPWCDAINTARETLEYVLKVSPGTLAEPGSGGPGTGGDHREENKVHTLTSYLGDIAKPFSWIHEGFKHLETLDDSGTHLESMGTWLTEHVIPALEEDGKHHSSLKGITSKLTGMMQDISGQCGLESIICSLLEMSGDKAEEIVSQFNNAVGIAFAQERTKRLHVMDAINMEHNGIPNEAGMWRSRLLIARQAFERLERIERPRNGLFDGEIGVKVIENVKDIVSLFTSISCGFGFYSASDKVQLNSMGAWLAEHVIPALNDDGKRLPSLKGLFDELSGMVQTFLECLSQVQSRRRRSPHIPGHVHDGNGSHPPDGSGGGHGGGNAPGGSGGGNGSGGLDRNSDNDTNDSTFYPSQESGGKKQCLGHSQLSHSSLKAPVTASGSPFHDTAQLLASVQEILMSSQGTLSLSDAQCRQMASILTYLKKIGLEIQNEGINYDGTLISFQGVSKQSRNCTESSNVAILMEIRPRPTWRKQNSAVYRMGYNIIETIRRLRLCPVKGISPNPYRSLIGSAFVGHSHPDSTGCVMPFLLLSSPSDTFTLDAVAESFRNDEVISDSLRKQVLQPLAFAVYAANAIGVLFLQVDPATIQVKKNGFNGTFKFIFTDFANVLMMKSTAHNRTAGNTITFLTRQNTSMAQPANRSIKPKTRPKAPKSMDKISCISDSSIRKVFANVKSLGQARGVDNVMQQQTTPPAPPAQRRGTQSNLIQVLKDRQDPRSGFKLLSVDQKESEIVRSSAERRNADALQQCLLRLVVGADYGPAPEIIPQNLSQKYSASQPMTCERWLRFSGMSFPSVTNILTDECLSIMVLPPEIEKSAINGDGYTIPGGKNSSNQCSYKDEYAPAVLLCVEPGKGLGIKALADYPDKVPGKAKGALVCEYVGEEKDFTNITNACPSRYVVTIISSQGLSKLAGKGLSSTRYLIGELDNLEWCFSNIAYGAWINSDSNGNCYLSRDEVWRDENGKLHAPIRVRNRLKKGHFTGWPYDSASGGKTPFGGNWIFRHQDTTQ